MSYARFEDLGCGSEKEQVVEGYGSVPRVPKLSENGRCGPNYNHDWCGGNKCCSRHGWCGGTKGKNSAWCRNKNKGGWGGISDGRYDREPENKPGVKYDGKPKHKPGSNVDRANGKLTFNHVSRKCNHECMYACHGKECDTKDEDTQQRCKTHCFNDKGLDYNNGTYNGDHLRSINKFDRSRFDSVANHCSDACKYSCDDSGCSTRKGSKAIYSCKEKCFGDSGFSPDE